MYITHDCDTIGGDAYITEQHCIIILCILYIIPLVSRVSDYWTNFCIDFLLQTDYDNIWTETAVFYVGS